MLQFFADLQKTLEERTPNKPDGVHLGTHDRRVEQGVDWDSELSEGLRNNKVLVTVATPHYFGRENCGKEIAVFARRHPAARVDGDGSLRDATNILHVRWLDDAAYQHNRANDALVHPVLRKVNWSPPEEGDPDRIRAVRRYRAKGMALCVKPGRDYYVELLRFFAQRIREMPDLPAATFVVEWNRIRSAFQQGWADEWQPTPAGPGPVVAAPATPPLPSGPADVAVFYVTRRPLPYDTRDVSFAGQLVDEPGRQSTVSPQPYLAVLRAVQQATQLEHLNDFHCACKPPIPNESGALIDQLAALTDRRVLVALIVDPTLWLGADPAYAATRLVIDQVMRSDRWGGPAVLPVLDEADRALKVPDLLAAREIPRAVSVLPESPEAMAMAFRSILIQERGRIMRGTALGASALDDQPPLLRGPGGEQRMSR